MSPYRGEGAEVLGGGAGWSEVGWGVVVVVVGKGSGMGGCWR
jgi:hypothetical protein